MITIDSPKAGRREWIGLAVLALPTLLISIDVFVVLLALPQLSISLGASSTQQLWILDIYGFMVGGFLITMGSLGDRIGRRKLLLIGAAVFGLASMLAAFSTSPLMLIITRAILGIAGATLAPSTLALISNMFRDPKQRGLAIGVWGGCFTIGAIIGPLVGGVVLSYFWWGSVFLLGVPVMALLFVLGPMFLPEYRDSLAARLDLMSVVLSLLTILPIIYGLKELAKGGMQMLPIVAIVVGLSFGVWFVRRQHTLSNPLLDLRLFTNRAFSAALLSMLCFSMLVGTTMVFVAQYLQLVEGLTPLQAGLGMVPGMVTSIVSFQLAPLLASRIRPAYLISAGLLVSVVGLLILTLLSGLATVVIGIAIASVGSGPLVTLGTNLVISSAPPEKAGSAAAIAQTSNESGYALGVALLGSIGTVVYRAQIADTIPAQVSSAAHESLAGAITASQTLSDQLAMALLSAARSAFTSGLQTIAAISAVLLIGVAILVIIYLRHVSPISEIEEEAAPVESLLRKR